MKDLNKIDRLFASLHDAEAPAPVHVWPRVASQIKKRKRGRRFPFWLGLFGFLMLSTAALWWSGSLAAKKDIITSRGEVPTLTVAPDSEPKSIDASPPAGAPDNEQPIASTAALSPAKKEKTHKRSSTAPIVKEKALHPVTDPRHAIAGKKAPDEKPMTANHRPATEFSKNQIVPKHQKLETALLQGLPLLAPNLPADRPAVTYTLNPNESCAGSRVIRFKPEWNLDVYVSPVLTSTYFAAKAQEFEGYAGLRDSTEGRNIGAAAGFRIGYTHSSGLNLQAGLAFQQMRTRFKYTVDLDEKMVVTTHRDANGNVIGRDTTFVYGRRIIDVANAYQTIDLPLAIGYEMKQNKIKMGFHAGAVLALKFAPKGYCLNEFAQLVTFDEKPAYKDQIGISFFGGVEWQYLFYDKWALFVEPQFRFYPQSITREDYPLKQNISTMYLLTGLRYSF